MEKARRPPNNDIEFPLSFADYSYSNSNLFQDKATGNKAALWLRAKLQTELLFPLGRQAQAHAKKILVAGAVVLLSLSVGLRGARTENRVDKLWVEGKK